MSNNNNGMLMMSPYALKLHFMFAELISGMIKLYTKITPGLTRTDEIEG